MADATDAAKEKRALEEVLDEVLSFNYRSLRTFRDILFRPGRVAATFASGDRETYTPTMRIWFGVISWLFLLSVIWGGFGELIVRASGAMGDPLSRFTVDGRRDIDAMVSEISTMAGLLYVPVSSLFILLGVNVLRVFNKSLTFIQTVQCYFVPVTAMALMSTIFLVASKFDARALFIAPAFNYSIFLLTAFPVVRAVFSKSWIGATIKTLTLTVVVGFLSALSTFLTLFSAIIYALTQVEPNF